MTVAGSLTRAPWWPRLPPTSGPVPEQDTTVAVLSPFTDEACTVQGGKKPKGPQLAGVLPFSQEFDEPVQSRGDVSGKGAGEKGEMTIPWEVETDIGQKHSHKGTFSLSKTEFCRVFFLTQALL